MSELQELRQRIEKLEAEVFKPCIYEARAYTAAPTVLTGGESVFGVWCQTHGWDCPRIKDQLMGGVG